MGTSAPLLRHAEQVMGTVVSFAVRPGQIPSQAASRAIAAACAVLHRADAIFSTWKPHSPVSRLRRGAALVSELPAEVAEVLDLCEEARKASAGWFDPWAIPGGVDPTGLVKGWAVEQSLAVLSRAGLEAAMINGGGDIGVLGMQAPGQSWRIGVRHPWRADAFAAIIEVTAAIATSGSYERGSHLIDPFTGRPASRAASATVTGPSLAIADALATAVAAGGDDAFAVVADLDHYGCYLIRPDGSEADTGNVRFTS
jgi:thiamine biosynthesis lipoprotein